MPTRELTENLPLKEADWELDFYSRPVFETDGKKRWELLISSTQNITGEEPFQWEKRCPASEVNSVWLTEAIEEALLAAKQQGWQSPSKVRCWRTSMKTMVKKAAETNGIELIQSKRTYSLVEWISHREKHIYPKETGYIEGPLPPMTLPIINQAIPLPEAVRGDSWNFAFLSIESLRDASEWSMQFNGLLPIKQSIKDEVMIPGIRLFSKSRSLAMAAWLGGLEPVRLRIEENQLLLEAGQSDRWLVTDINQDAIQAVKESFENSKREADGIQFISIQSSLDDVAFAGFWMLKDLN